MSSTKDYVRVAEVIRSAAPADTMSREWANGCDSAREYIARHLADAYAADNPRFDRARFLSACAVTA